MSKLTIHHKVEVNVQKQIFWALMDLIALLWLGITWPISFLTGDYVWGFIKLCVWAFIVVKYTILKNEDIA